MPDEEHTASAVPANPNTTKKARAVLAYLRNLPKGDAKRVISGQFIGHPLAGLYDNAANLPHRIHEQTGKWVGFLGGDYGRGFERQDEDVLTPALIEHWNNGGLVGASVHWHNPRTGRGHQTTPKPHIPNLLDPNSAVHGDWMEELSYVADKLTVLRDAGAVVLWRPFNECTCRIPKWWQQHSYKDFCALYRQVFDYMTKTRGLDNLLWEYHACRRKNEKRLWADHYYPGAELVDIVGLTADREVLPDTDAFVGDYQRLVALGKPFAFGEANMDTRLHPEHEVERFIRGIKTHYPRAVYFMCWGGSFGLHNRPERTRALLNDPWVINRDELRIPGLSR